MNGPVTYEAARRVLDNHADQLTSTARAMGAEVYGVAIGKRGAEFVVVVLVDDVQRASGLTQRVEGVLVVYEQGGPAYAL